MIENEEKVPQPDVPDDTLPADSPPPLRPEQGEMPFAMVRGEAVTELPKDLYIPPQALEVFLDALSGFLKPCQLKHGNITRSGFRVLRTNEIGTM